MSDFDTDAAGILIGDDTCEVASALAASYRPPTSTPPAARGKPTAFYAGLLIGLVLFVLWLFWQ